MSIGQTSVQDAIARGIKVITYPSRLILRLASLACILLLIFDFSWWDLLLIPAGVISSAIYRSWAVPLWRIWAYEHVSDIHQLQRTAELFGLLHRGSHERTGGIMTIRQKSMLMQLQKRFSDAAVFVDDPIIPAETPLYKPSFLSISDELVMTLNDSGIEIHSEGFFAWEDVMNDRVVQITYNRINWRTGGKRSAGWKYLFRFESDERRFEIPLWQLNISPWELDLYLYIYRGRSARK
jgi:hypothetical protein